jgi:hypothetical protein
MSNYQNSGNSGISENAEEVPLREMSKRFTEAKATMEQCRATLLKIANRMDNEHALVGVCGTEFVNLLRGEWAGKVQTIDNKMDELAKDIVKALDRITAAEADASASVRN